jgi:hypothetical protein
MFEPRTDQGLFEEVRGRLFENVLVSRRFIRTTPSLFRVLLFHPEFGSGFLPALTPWFPVSISDNNLRTYAKFVL